MSARTAPGPVDRIVAVPARATGAVLATAVHAMARARRSAKPLHPRGGYRRATLTRSGGGATGVPWLDTPGTDQVVVRMSRAFGLPRGWPDIHGIALRLRLGDRDADLLFATTGWGRLTRFVPTVARAAGVRPTTTLFPCRAPEGPVVLGMLPEDDDSFLLAHACGTGPWTTFGRLVLEEPYDGPALAFDPVLAPVPGLPPYAWVSALRRPSYRTAQRGRTGFVGPDTGPEGPVSSGARASPRAGTPARPGPS